MIFINSIFKDNKIAKYLRILLSAKFQDKTYYIIYSYFSIFKTNTKTT